MLDYNYLKSKIKFLQSIETSDIIKVKKKYKKMNYYYFYYYTKYFATIVIDSKEDTAVIIIGIGKDFKRFTLSESLVDCAKDKINDAFYETIANEETKLSEQVPNFLVYHTDENYTEVISKEPNEKATNVLTIHKNFLSEGDVKIEGRFKQSEIKEIVSILLKEILQKSQNS